MADIPKANEIKQEIEKAIIRADDSEVGAVIQNRNFTIASVASIKKKLRVLRTNLDDWLADVNLTAKNIKNGVKIFGVTGTFPNDGTAQPGEVLTGKTFYNNSATKRTGTMPNQGGMIITPSTTNIAIPAGYHDGTGYVKGIPKYKEISDIIVKYDESASYGGTIYALTFDGTYLYVGGSTTNKVWKINPSTMSKVAESTSYGGTIYALAFDGTYLYAGGYRGYVWKINPSNMSKVAESADYGGTIYALTFDGTYLYAGGGTTRKVWKINPSTMSKVAESADYGGIIYALTFDGTYLYAGGGTTRKVWKINPSTMSKVAESADYGESVRALTSDGTYLYAGGGTGYVWKINPSNMSKVAESADYGGTIYALTFDGTYLYAGGGTTRKVWKTTGTVYIKEV